MMTNTVLLVFTQPNCPPCYRLKDYIRNMPHEEQELIEMVPFKTPDGEKTALATELDIKLTPTLVVANEEMVCEEPDEQGFRVCEFRDDAIETIVGANNIVTALPGVINNYIKTEFV